jgi:predicted nucleic acid-binding protein
MVCIDASVFVSFGRPTEVNHEESTRFLSRTDEVAGIVAPALVQVECAGALARRTDNTERALRFAAGLRDLPGIQMQRMTAGLVRKACRIAAHHRIRGADAIYVATAVEEGAILVTWD